MVHPLRIKLAFLGVLLVAVVMRFWQLTVFPVSLNIDEVSNGYAAYSLLHTGRDEWGAIAPLVFYSLGDYKPPANTYLEVPAIALFGLTEFSVRLPVAVIGALTSLVFIVLLRRLNLPLGGALVGGLWLAVSPWHTHFSRFGIEAVTAVFFTLCGVTLFLSAVKKQSFFQLALSVISLALAVWSYHSTRLFVPLLAVFLLAVFRRQLAFLRSSPAKALVVAGLLALLSAPFIYLTVFSPAIRTRAAMTSIFRDPFLLPTLHRGQYADLAEKVFDNDIYLVFHHWISKYIDYFDIRLWFFKGLNFTPPGYPDLGLLYLIDLPLFAAGVWYVIHKPRSNLGKLLLFWLFAGPLAASFTMNDQHTLRSLIWLPFFGITITAGAVQVKKYLPLYFLALPLAIGLFWDLYSVQYPKYFAEARHYGYKEAAVYACANAAKYDRIIISPEFGTLGPFIRGVPDYYVLFYCQYPPAQFLATRRIPKFDFIKVDWRKEVQMELNSLLIAPKWDFPDLTPPAANVVHRVDYPLTSIPAFYFVETRSGKTI